MNVVFWECTDTHQSLTEIMDITHTVEWTIFSTPSHTPFKTQLKQNSLLWNMQLHNSSQICGTDRADRCFASTLERITWTTFQCLLKWRGDEARCEESKCPFYHYSLTSTSPTHFFRFDFLLMPHQASQLLWIEIEHQAQTSERQQTEKASCDTRNLG